MDEKQKTPPVGAQGSADGKRVKLRLDVKDVVRKRTGASGDKTDDGIYVLYEDNHLLVVIKPQGVPAQGDSSGDDDMISRLKRYLVKKYDKPGDAYIGSVHRLDRPTGGIMVFAKTSKAAQRLTDQIQSDEGEFEKKYAAVVSGRPNKTGKLEHYLVKDTQANVVSVVPSSIEGAKLAVSEIETVDEKDGLTLVRVKLMTGRTHQIRVQLKAVGSPVVGDIKYAGAKLVKSPHLALWAYRLAFIHPTTGDKMIFLAPPPDEFPWNRFDTEGLLDIVRPN